MKKRILILRGRAKITSHFPAGSFSRGLCCLLLTDPRAGYARRSRLAGGQNSRAVKYEFIYTRPLTGCVDKLGPVLATTVRPATPNIYPAEAGIRFCANITPFNLHRDAVETRERLADIANEKPEMNHPPIISAFGAKSRWRIGNIFSRMSRQTPSFPVLSAVIVGGGVPWLGLLAAAWGWRWTSETVVGPAWSSAWLYANMMLGAVLLVIVPALTTIAPRRRILDICWSLIIILLAALPTLAAAGWFSRINIIAAINMLLIQLALVILTLGFTAWITQLSDIGRALFAGLSTVLFLLPPGIWLIQVSTCPWLTGEIWSHWITVFPAPLIQQAGDGRGLAMSFYWIIGLYAISGAIMIRQAVVRRTLDG